MKTVIVSLIALMMLASPVDAKARRDEGPDLPYSCLVVRAGAALRGFSNPPTKAQRIQIRQLETEHGITPKQHRQAVACFRGKK